MWSTERDYSTKGERICVSPRELSDMWIPVLWFKCKGKSSILAARKPDFPGLFIIPKSPHFHAYMAFLCEDKPRGHMLARYCLSSPCSWPTNILASSHFSPQWTFHVKFTIFFFSSYALGLPFPEEFLRKFEVALVNSLSTSLPCRNSWYLRQFKVPEVCLLLMIYFWSCLIAWSFLPFLTMAKWIADL